MKITHWVEVRRYLKRTSLVLLLVSLSCIWMSLKEGQELMAVRGQYLVERSMLLEASKNLQEKKGKIDALTSTIARQDKQITVATTRITEWRQKLLNLELARDITAYLQKIAPELQVQRGSFNTIYLTIFYAQKYEKIYQKRYPSFAQFFSWKGCLNIIWVESKFDPFCRSYYSALGEVQVVEYESYRLKDGTINPDKRKNLYPMLCSMGYKKITYKATIEAYMNSPEEQVDCFYHVFYQKLRDVGGDYTAAVVAYHYRVADPENATYWKLYLEAKRKFNAWYEDADQKTR